MRFRHSLVPRVKGDRLPMARPRWKIAALLGCLAMVLAACGGGGDGGSGSGGSDTSTPTGTITVWARDSQQTFMSKLVDLYNKDHQVQAKVTIIPASNFV